jgi:hypothetical protein
MNGWMDGWMQQRGRQDKCIYLTVEAIGAIIFAKEGMGLID